MSEFWMHLRPMTNKELDEAKRQSLVSGPAAQPAPDIRIGGDKIVSTPHATPPAPDDLVARCGSMSRALRRNERLTAADCVLISGTLDEAAAEIVALRDRVAELERVNDSIHKLIDDKESALFADNAKLRACVKAADVMRNYINWKNLDVYDAARAALGGKL